LKIVSVRSSAVRIGSGVQARARWVADEDVGCE